MNILPDLPCYLNGESTILPLAKISVMDRGFIFGDGIYEVVPVYAGHLFRFDHHMARLERSLKECRIPNPHSRAEWVESETGCALVFDAHSPFAGAVLVVHGALIYQTVLPLFAAGASPLRRSHEA